MSSTIDHTTPAEAAEPTESPEKGRISITLFPGGEKSKGRRRITTWGRLFEVFVNALPSKTADKLKLEGWSPAMFSGDHRTKENTIEVCALVLDFDNTVPNSKPKIPLPEEQVVTIERARAAFPGAYKCAYTSWSHEPTWPHFRLVLPYSRPISGVEHERIWAIVNERLLKERIVCDAQCKDPSRLWFVPARRDDHFMAVVEDGVLLDVDAILGPEPEVGQGNTNADEVRRRVLDEVQSGVPLNEEDISIDDYELEAAIEVKNVPLVEKIKRASRYVSKMPAAVSGSGGHVATLKVAAALVRGFALEPDVAFVVMRDEFNPRCQPVWSEKELRHKVADASKENGESRPLGYLLRTTTTKLKRKSSGSAPPGSGPSNGGASMTPADDSSGACTDLGNAERLVRRHGSDLRWVGLWEKWIVWSQTHWAVATKKQVESFAQQTVRSIYQEAADSADPDRRKTLAAHAKASESNSRKVAMIDQAKSLPGIPILPDELDRDPWLLNVRNGTIDLKTGVLRDHRREDLITKVAGASYDAEAGCPLFDAFLSKVLPDSAVREHVLRLDGYALTGVVQDHVLPIHYGAGSNGKSVHASVLEHIWGDYARQIPTELLMSKRGDSHPTEKTTLFGVRLALAVESDENRALNVAFVKQATGGDKITARRMREDFWEFVPTHKLQLSTNHRPVIKETKHAIWRRVLLIPWTVTIPTAEQDKRLTEKLKAEAPGILARLVRACLDWQRSGLATPTVVQAATNEYRADMDTLGKFICDCCDVGDSLEEGSTPLFKAFVEWAGQNNEKSMTMTFFGNQLTERGYPNGRNTRTGLTVRLGLRLLVPNPRLDTALAKVTGGDPSCDISAEDIDQALEDRTTAEGSEGSEGNSGFAGHESEILGRSGNSLQTLQTLQDPSISAVLLGSGSDRLKGSTPEEALFLTSGVPDKGGNGGNMTSVAHDISDDEPRYLLQNV